MLQNEFLGQNETIFFFGVVEDRQDPEKLGRVRVRIFGVHSELRTPNDEQGEGIPTEDLPWAYPIQSITSAAMHGIGETPVGFVEGTHIVGIARDGYTYQDLIILGSVGGFENEKPKNTGFHDPNQTYPKEEYIDENDTNRLARNEKTDKTIVQEKKDNAESGVKTPNGSWDEPKTPYDAKYPHNQVKESESGHIHEVDDTEGAERLHKYHKDGSFEEYHPKGDKVQKIVKDNYEIVAGDDYLYVKGICNITVEGDSNLYVKGDVNEKVDGNAISEIGGNVEQTIGGNCEQEVSGSVTVKALDVSIEASKCTVQSSSIELKAATVNASGNIIVGGVVKASAHI